MGEGVFKIFLEAVTEVVQSGLVVLGAENAIFGTFAPAVGEIRATSAFAGEKFVFGVAEFNLGG